MARNWPTKSKGTFYDGYGRAGVGAAPAERDPEHKTKQRTRGETARSRMVHPATNRLTKESMRKPL